MVLYPAWNLDILSCGCAGIKVIAEMIIQAIESLLSRMLVQFHVYESSSVLSVYKFPPKLNDFKTISYLQMSKCVVKSVLGD